MSDDSDECIHGLGPVSACVICNGRVAKEAAAAKEDSKVKYWFAAKFAGRLDCGCESRVGESIGRRNDGRLTCDWHQ